MSTLFWRERRVESRTSLPCGFDVANLRDKGPVCVDQDGRAVGFGALVSRVSVERAKRGNGGRESLDIGKWAGRRKARNRKHNMQEHNVRTL